jgi:hypothetical protein
MISFAKKTLGDFFKKKPKEELTICVCAVTSYSVTGAVVRVFNREGAVSVPVVLFSCEEKTSVRNLIDEDGLEISVISHAKKVLEKCRSFHGVFDRIVYVVGEPWTNTTVRSMRIERSKPFKVTTKMIDEAIARDKKLFESEIERNFSGESIAIIETAQPVVNINGYRVSTFEGVMAKTIDIQSTVSVAPGIFIEELVDAFSEIFHHTEVLFATMNTAEALLVNPKGTAVVLALGGIESSLVYINHGVATETVTIPRGLMSFEENIMATFDVPQAQVMRVMQFANDEHFLQHHRDLYYKRIEAAYQDLGDDITKGLLQLKQRVTIPQPIYILGNPAWLPSLESYIVRDTAYEIVTPSVTVLNERIMYAHTAPVRNIMLSLAVLRAIDSRA